MTTATLLSDLTARGVEFCAQGDKLRFRPVDLLTDVELMDVRGFKAEIINLLNRGATPVPDLPATAASYPPLDPADPRSWGPPPLRRLTGLCVPIREEERIQPHRHRRVDQVCPRCRSTEHTDVPIHAGRSTRRDCRKCGKFLGFPVWIGRAAR
jgi:hypothetical protein